MRGMLSVDESKFPALFILVSPALVHTFLDPKGVAWHPKESRFKMPGFEVHFLCIVCQLTGRVKHKPIELKIPSKEFADFMRKAATPIKIACALLRLGLVAAKVASGGLVPIPLAILNPIEEMGALCDEISEFSTDVVKFIDVSIAENELGEKVSILKTPFLQHSHHLIVHFNAQSGEEKLDKLDQMKQQMQASEGKADVKTSRLLVELLDKFSDVEGHDELAIKQLANLYRCIHKDKGTVIWICDDADALARAEKLDFIIPSLNAGRMEPDKSKFKNESEGNEGTAASTDVDSTDTDVVAQGAVQSKGCTIL
jgi:hypothetical protein